MVSQRCRACWKRALVTLRLILMGARFCLPCQPHPFLSAHYDWASAVHHSFL